MLKTLALRKATSEIIYKKYDKAYKDLIDGAFANDEKDYKKLLDALRFWNKRQYDKVHKVLDELLTQCTCTRDYWVVYEVKAMAYLTEGRDIPLIGVYQAMLQYDSTHSRILSNLGLIYLKVGKTLEAKDALTKAIEYDPDSYLANNNIAAYYMKTADFEKTLEYALKAMKIDPKPFQPYSAAAIASKMLGNLEDADRYLQLYIDKGGQKEKVEAILAAL